MKKALAYSGLLILAIAVSFSVSADETMTNGFTNSIGQEFVLIPAGSFMMGSPENKQGRAAGDAQHQVTISKPFYMQKTEVTQGQWEKVMGNNPSENEDCGPNCPVRMVSWNDAQEFIRRLNKLEGTEKYRLPTEAQWEYSARAGTSTAYYWGDRMDGSYAWCAANADKSHSVGQKNPNAWGLYDMTGNVLEWCEDWWEDYPTGPITDPRGPDSGKARVFRGGSFNDAADACRIYLRYGGTPNFRYSCLGFRLAATGSR